MRSFDVRVRRLVLLGVLAVLAGCNRQPTGGDSKPGEQGKDKTPPPPSADFKVTTPEIIVEFKKDPKAYQAKYTDKKIEVTGYLEKIQTFEDHGPVLWIGTERYSPTVNCFPADPKPWAKALPGQTVKVRGLLQDPSKYPALKDCEIVEATGAKPAAVDAKALADDQSNNGSPKHNLQLVIVTGDPGGPSSEYAPAKGPKSYTLEFLTPGAKQRVIATFAVDPRPAIRALAPGKSIQVLGECNPGAPGYLELREAILLGEAP
jgi:hypothetical protein